MSGCGSYAARVSEPWVRFEDEHVLVVGKPAGVTTHRADRFAQDGMYEWVQRQRPSDRLSILHRLDKATSGLLLFGKSAEANRSLGAQFERRSLAKRYELLAPRDDERQPRLHCEEPVAGTDKGKPVDRTASTDFELDATGEALQRYSARPHSGRTHQVRIHAAALGMPILGDDEHGGLPAARLYLHAAGLRFDHPVVGGIELEVERPASFDRVLAASADWLTDPAIAALVALESRRALLDPVDTDSFLWIDRQHDGFPDTRVELLGDAALVLRYGDSPAPSPSGWLAALREAGDVSAIFEQHRPKTGGEPARLISGTHPSRFEVTELGCRYLVDLDASATSTGLFLDQRETRRELLQADLVGRTVLNTFAHTGSLSVAAALAGAETLSLDLSKHYLAWAADNLRLNGLDPAHHDFIYGDAMEWMERLVKKGRTFDVVLVDPPSSSTPRRRGAARWVADRDLHGLVERAARLCAEGGRLYVSTNLRRLSWPDFIDHLERGLTAAGRTGIVEPRTLPLDHRSGAGDPPYLKAAWIHVDR